MRDWGACDHPAQGPDADPLQVVTIASGFAGYNIWLFIVLSSWRAACGSSCWRSCCSRYGEPTREFIEKRLGFWVTLSVAVLVGGIVAALYLF